jgi:hypothetical protein
MTSEEILEVPSGGYPNDSVVYKGSPAEARIAELEIEIARLQRSVAELLLKNQQLRKQEA